jgi:hypothetical protein
MSCDSEIQTADDVSDSMEAAEVVADDAEDAVALKIKRSDV